MNEPNDESAAADVVPTQPLSRRGVVRAGLRGGAGLAGAAALAVAGAQLRTTQAQDVGAPATPHQADHPIVMPGVVGEVDHEANGFNPTDILTDFDAGEVSQLPNGQTLHTYQITALNKEIELVPGTVYPAWTYNGRIPGPTIRVREGDRVRVEFTNGGDHPHSIHFHGVHSASMDGVFDAESGQIQPGEEFTYEFDAEPAGFHLYHCHTPPLAEHIAKGLYGAFIIDPKDGWPRVDHEFIMVMSGFDIDFDAENDLYVVNGIPFHYDLHMNPIKLKVGDTVRIFLGNMLEFDQINSFHLHANFFNYYPTGTSRTPSEFTDTIMQAQGQRGILEFRYKFPGRYMFHAHVTEFAELGWMGFFEVEE